MPILESERGLLQVYFSCHCNFIKKLLLIMIIELLDYTVAPRFRRRNKPRFHSTV